MGLSADLNDEEAVNREGRRKWDQQARLLPATFHEAWLPVILGAGAQGNPPLGCSSSPSSKGSRGRGLNSRLGREEASRTLQERETLSAHIPLLPLCCPRTRLSWTWAGPNQSLPHPPNTANHLCSHSRPLCTGMPLATQETTISQKGNGCGPELLAQLTPLSSHLLAQTTTAISHRALLPPGTQLILTHTAPRTLS